MQPADGAPVPHDDGAIYSRWTNCAPLCKNCPQNGVERTYDGGYRFPDGKVWMYAEREAVAPDGGIYLEASFTDATDLSRHQ